MPQAALHEAVIDSMLYKIRINSLTKNLSRDKLNLPTNSLSNIQKEQINNNRRNI